MSGKHERETQIGYWKHSAHHNEWPIWKMNIARPLISYYSITCNCYEFLLAINFNIRTDTWLFLNLRKPGSQFQAFSFSFNIHFDDSLLLYVYQGKGIVQWFKSVNQKNCHFVHFCNLSHPFRAPKMIYCETLEPIIHFYPRRILSLLFVSFLEEQINLLISSFKMEQAWQDWSSWRSEFRWL